MLLLLIKKTYDKSSKHYLFNVEVKFFYDLPVFLLD